MIGLRSTSIAFNDIQQRWQQSSGRRRVAPSEITGSHGTGAPNGQADQESGTKTSSDGKSLTLEEIRRSDGEFWSSGEALRFTIIPNNERWGEDLERLNRVKKNLRKILKKQFANAHMNLESNDKKLAISVEFYGVIRKHSALMISA